MILITVKEWIGPQKHLAESLRQKLPEPDEQIIGFCTRMKINDALKHLHEYQEAFRERERFICAEFSVIAISEVDDIDDHLLPKLGMLLIEDLEPMG